VDWGGQGVLGGVDKTMLMSNEINKDRIHTYKLQWANLNL